MPTIGGRREYLPLTRRIERGRHFSDLAGRTEAETLKKIQDTLSKKIHELENLRSKAQIDCFIRNTSSEIETFLDNPSWGVPPSVAALLADVTSEEQKACIREIGWHCYYMFALLPAHKRVDYAVMQAEEEITSHFNHVKTEYDQSKKTLVEGTLRYVIRLARHYAHSGIPYLDLVQEGVMGLMQASEKFEESIGTHFQSYAASWIKQRITRYIADHSLLIRLPVHQHEKVSVIIDKHQQLWDTHGYPPTDFKLYLEMEWLTQEDISLIQQHQQQEHYRYLIEKLSEYREMFTYRDQPASAVLEKWADKVFALDLMYEELTASLGHEPDEYTLYKKLGWLADCEIEYLNREKETIDTRLLSAAQSRLRKAQIQMNHYRLATATHYSLETTSVTVNQSGQRKLIREYLVAQDDIEQSGDRRLLEDELQILLTRLSEREQHVINLRFGLQDGQEKTLEEVGQQFGLTRERIRQIEAKVKRKLVKPLMNQRMASYLREDM